MSGLIDTTEMYLKSIWELGEDGIPPLRVRLTERLGQSVPTVSQTVGRMERDGLLTLRENRLLEFTRLGRGYAMRVMRKHRLSELLLLEVLGMDLEAVHDEACRWEHVVSRQAEERIVALVADPGRDPFGNPIPGLGELGVHQDAQPGFGTAIGAAPVPSAILVRLGEPVQTDRELVRLLRNEAILPGVALSADRVGERWVLRRLGGHTAVEVPGEVVRHVFVDSPASGVGASSQS